MNSGSDREEGFVVEQSLLKFQDGVLSLVRWNHPSDAPSIKREIVVLQDRLRTSLRRLMNQGNRIACRVSPKRGEVYLYAKSLRQTLRYLVPEKSQRLREVVTPQSIVPRGEMDLRLGECP